MNQFGVGTSSEDAQDADLQAITVTSTVKVGGVSLLALGVLTLVLCLQTALAVRFDSVSTPIVLTMFSIGLACALVGFYLTRGSGKAAVSGTALSGLAFVLLTAWLIFATIHGFFSLLCLALIPLALIACFFSALTIPWTRRADAARERLREQGLDLGL